MGEFDDDDDDDDDIDDDDDMTAVPTWNPLILSKTPKSASLEPHSTLLLPWKSSRFSSSANRHRLATCIKLTSYSIKI
jgi:hypothetical protein